jgi:tetratricopeptide (TPR) repeat protein
MSSQSSGMRYQDFTVQVVPRLAGRYVVYAQCPQGEGKGPFKLPPAWRAGRSPAEPRPRGPLRDLKGRPRQVPGPSENAGERLFEALFPPDVLRLYERCLDQVKKDHGTGLRVKLMIDPDDPELSGLLALPWEELRQPGMPEFLALSRWHSIVRYLMVPRPVEAAKRPPKLRILILAASPRGLSILNLERERRNLEEALRPASGAVEIVEAPRPTLAGLREVLRSGEIHVLHFMGHGSFDEDAAGGSVYFETEDGGKDPVRGEDLANKLADFPQLRLVVLNACHSARVSESSEKSGAQPFTGVATSLVMGGLPAVIAMRSPISDNAAIAFSRTFYQRLAAGDPVDAAVVEGRQAIHSETEERAEWATPALFMRTREGDLFPAESLPPEKYPARPWWPGWLAAALLLVLLGAVVWLLYVERFTREGSRFLQQGRSAEAREALSKALALAPYSAEIHLGLAMAESKRGRPEAAEEHFSRAAQLKPHDPKYRVHWAAYLDDRQRYDQAARELSRAIADDKTYVPAYNELALNEIEQGFWSAARTTLTEGLKYASAAPESPSQLYDKLGQIDLQQGLIDGAVVHLSKALDYPQEHDQQAKTLAFLAEAYAHKSNVRGVCETVGKFQVIDRVGTSEKTPDVKRLGEQFGCPPDFDAKEKG